MNALIRTDMGLDWSKNQHSSPIFQFATIGEVYEDGVSLILDGATIASTKHYLVNASVVFAAGDRVKICADSGTYVVEYVVGKPGSRVST